MGKRLSLIVLFGLLVTFLVSFDYVETKKSTLTISFNNIRNTNGKIFVFIYNYENQYPYNPYLDFEIDKKRVTKYGTLKFTIPKSLLFGKYAISILDDENENEDLDTFLGMPTEGYGFSNNISPFLSMPDYKDLLFNLTTKKKTINLTLQYFL